VEHSVAREALRLGLVHHRTIATRLKGIQVERDIASMFEQQLAETYIKMMDIDIFAGTGGLLSHAPERIQSMFILIDAWQPEGVTKMFQDSVFMMPHLGVLSTVYRDAAWSIFDKDCLVRLGTCIAPAGTAEPGEEVMTVELKMPSGETLVEKLTFGEVRRIELPERSEAEAVIQPAKRFDVGKGDGNVVETTIMGGVAGVLMDARGRPLVLPEEVGARRRLLQEWFKVLDLYPEEELEEII
jgi:hypothetical protein